MVTRRVSGQDVVAVLTGSDTLITLKDGVGGDSGDTLHVLLKFGSGGPVEAQAALGGVVLGHTAEEAGESAGEIAVVTTNTDVGNVDVVDSGDFVSASVTSAVSVVIAGSAVVATTVVVIGRQFTAFGSF